VADIHFSAELAVEAIKCGCDAVRINPGNMRDWRDVRKVIDAAKKSRVPIRIGVNSGSIRERRGWEIKRGARKKDLVALMVDTTLDYCKQFERYGFCDIKLSLKTPDARSTMECYRAVAARCDYPLHLGLTAAGPKEESEIKSAIAIGGLLAEGIGDTIRVSSTGRPHDEVTLGHRILRAVGLERAGISIYPCPTCGRCEVDLGGIVREVKRKTARIDKDVTVAIMGCIVNGPGEAAEADIGVACGKNFAYLFKNGRRLKRLSPRQIVPALLKHIRLM
jgi:(E)-4-hydroxy-3-methylbut-2-enyl-diphosphate synthase